MAGKHTAVFGIYPNYASVENGVDGLKAAGFSNRDISVLFPQSAGSKDFAHEKGTKAPEGATAGAGTGVVLGGAMGWLMGVGALAIPGLGGAVGGIAGALVGMGIPEYEAKRYEGRVKDGGILISVHCEDSEWKNRAKQILEATGAQDISATSEARSDDA